MPITSTGLCGPKVLSKALGITLQEAQTYGRWNPDKGTSPQGMLWAFEKCRYVAQYKTGQNLDELNSLYRGGSIIVLNFWAVLFGSPPDGHYVLFRGLSPAGNVVMTDSDMPQLEQIEIPRAYFETFWFDYSIDKWELLSRPAIIASKFELHPCSACQSTEILIIEKRGGYMIACSACNLSTKTHRRLFNVVENWNEHPTA